MNKRHLAIVIACLIAVIILYFFLSGGKKSAEIRSSGTVEGIEINIASKAAGKISELCCREGETVIKGQIVVRLESADLKASVEQAVAGVRKAEADAKSADSAALTAKINIGTADASISEAKAGVDNARAVMDEAEKEKKRTDDLFKQGFVAKASVDQADSAYSVSVAANKAAIARLDVARSQKAGAQSQLEAANSQSKAAIAALKASEANLAFAQARLSDMVIASPITGTVIFRPLETGETVSTGSTILTIVDLDSLFVRTDIDEGRIANVKLGSRALIHVDSIPDKVFQGRVSEIGQYAEFATQRDVTRGRQDIKTFRVKILIEDKSGVLKPGMTVATEIPLK